MIPATLRAEAIACIRGHVPPTREMVAALLDAINNRETADNLARDLHIPPVAPWPVVIEDGEVRRVGGDG